MDQNTDKKYNEAIARNIAYRKEQGAYETGKTIEAVKHKLGIRQNDNRFDKEVKQFIAK